MSLGNILGIYPASGDSGLRINSDIRKDPSHSWLALMGPVLLEAPLQHSTLIRSSTLMVPAFLDLVGSGCLVALTHLFP